MEKSNGYSKRKYEKQCDKHLVTWSKVKEWDGFGKLTAGHSETFHLAVFNGKQEKG